MCNGILDATTMTDDRGDADGRRRSKKNSEGKRSSEVQRYGASRSRFFAISRSQQVLAVSEQAFFVDSRVSRAVANSKSLGPSTMGRKGPAPARPH